MLVIITIILAINCHLTMDMQVSLVPVPSANPPAQEAAPSKYRSSSTFGPPLDLSFRCLMCPSDALDETTLDTDQSTGQPRKFNTNVLRLNNNSLNSFEAFTDTFSQLVQSPEEISWIDLSFNMLPNIDRVIATYKNIRVLYLHGNSIDSLEEVNKLVALPHLRTLTMHGNPIESEPGYRQYVLSRLPGLKNLDFSGVTKQDRSIAETWYKMHGPKRGKRHGRRS